MGKVTSDISMSLDGFITDPNAGVGNALGDDPGRLQDWMFDAKTETDAAIVDEIYESTGAVLIGKRMFDLGVEPWGDPPPSGSRVCSDSRRARAPGDAGRNDLHLRDGWDEGRTRAGPRRRRPATFPQPSFDVRVTAGRVEVRRAESRG